MSKGIKEGMSNLGAIHNYPSQVDKIIRFGGSTKETSIRRAISTTSKPHPSH